jgi:DNA-binding beta-propeller fold protein YncE
MFRHGSKRIIAVSLLAVATLGCPGNGSDGQSPQIRFLNSAECIRFAGGFPPGFTALPGSGREAAVVQFIPTAILGLDLDREPPGLLASSAIPNFPGFVCDRCGGIVGVDSDSDGVADICRSDELGFTCLSPVAGNLSAIDFDLVALSTSNYEQVVFIDPRDGRTRLVELDTPSASANFDPADWPFWPTPGNRPARSAISTRACVYTQMPDSLGLGLGPNQFCDASREGFVTRFTSGTAVVGDTLFAATSNLLRSSQARYAPGTVLAFELDTSVAPPVVRPDADRAILFTSGFNPTSLEPYTTPTGRRLMLVGVSGAIAIGAGPDLVRTDSAIDVIDVDSRTLIATIPLGLAGLGDSGIEIDPLNRVALIGAFTSRALFGIDLAALDDPFLGLGPEPLPIVLDGTTPGFPDARIFDAAAPFVLPKRPDGPSASRCATITSVAISQVESYAVATDFCDGTISVLDIEVPPSRTTPIDAGTLLSIARVEEVASPILDTATGLTRAIDRVLIRAGRPGVDFTGPDVYFTAGLPEGAVCGVRINAL